LSLLLLSSSLLFFIIFIIIFYHLSLFPQYYLFTFSFQGLDMDNLLLTLSNEVSIGEVPHKCTQVSCLLQVILSYTK